jgi:ubiquitin carboxyl-terminal hydrolase 34
LKPNRNTFLFQSFLNEVFQFLFALPSPKKRFLPKSKSQTSRGAAYDLLVEFVKGSVENFRLLHGKMMQQHSKGILIVNSQKKEKNVQETASSKIFLL